MSAGTLARLQGSYYVATGIWSLAHRRSFERVTGPKTDYWLVRSVGGLALAIGVSLWLAGRNESSVSGAPLAVTGALAFAAADVQAARASSRVYLVDGLLELLLVAAWVRRVRAS